MAAALVPATAWAVQKPRPEDRVLPNFDSRVAGPRAPAPPPGVESALERLRGLNVPTLQARFDPLTRTVRGLSARDGALTAPSADPPEAIARGFLRVHGELFGLTEADLPGLVRTREYATDGGMVRHVFFEQAFGGIAVFGAVIGVHLDRAGRIVWITSGAVPRGDDLPAVPALSAEDAVRAAAADIRPELAIEPRALKAAAGPDRAALFARGPFQGDIPARLVYFPAHPRPRLAWRVLIEPAGFPQAYDVLVDAEAGQVLYRRNRVLYAAGVGNVAQSDATALQDARRPDEHPAGSAPAGPGDPASGCPPVSGYGPRGLTGPLRDPATVLSDTGRLSGNNVRAYRGAAGVWGALGASLDGTWRFEFPFGSAGSAETGLFFASNFVHDFFYDLGFDEAAGNFQADNFGRGGLGGDPLRAVARGTSGRNNATFQPAPEGQSPTMTMFLFDASGCWSADVDGDGVEDLDGDYDSDVVIHEFHHGVSHRLNTAFNSPEADAMGEGGSDFFAYSISGDTRLAEYVMPPDGIRWVNDKTYADWFCFFFFFCEPHDNGEIWANVLWDVRERFRLDQVEGSEGAAIHEAHRLYVDGLKLSPAGPTMLELRDSMLQADHIRNPSADAGGSENYCRLWSAFAGRGMGLLALDTRDTGDNSVVADFSVPAVCPQPPPKPTVTVAATDAAASEVGSDTATFTFTRTGDTGQELQVAYTTGGTATAGSDYVVLSGTITIPAGSAQATVVVAPLNDTLVEPGETVEVTVSPGSAYVIGSPALATATISSDDVAADLVITALSVPSTAGAGLTLTISETTKNQGTGAAATSVTRFHLSRDASLDAADVTLGGRAVPPLAPGAASPASTTVTVPAGTASGVWYVIAQADADGALAEIHEGNNTWAAFLLVGPDLVVSALSVPPTGGAGGTITASETTRNQGAGSAGGSLTRFYLSSNALVDAGDTLLGSRTVPALSPGASSPGSTNLTIPGATATGGYYVLALGDAEGVVGETQEGNNTGWAFIQIGPDLVVSTLSAPATSGAGASITVTETTRNQGGGTAGASTTRFLLSTNAVLDAADVLLGSRPVPALGPGAASPASTSLAIPAGTASGAYYLLVQADGAAVLGETQEGNNLAYAFIQIGPDLVVSPLTAPSTAGAGATISVGDTTRNLGAGTAAASVTKLYLSTNALLDGADTVLGSRPVGVLAGGASSPGSTAVTIPGGTAPGLYYVIGQADGDGTVAETQEANNLAFVAVQVGPDLVIASLFAPGTTGAGATVTVTDSTRNQGGGTAGASTTRFYLSTNATLDPGDVPLGSRPVAALGPGASSVASTSLTIPAGTPSGTHFLLAQADGATEVGETYEGNNTSYAFIQVGPDLIVAPVAAPAAAAAGATITVSDTTRNQGAGAAGASATKLYLSTNPWLDASDTPLGGRAVGPLAAGATSPGSTAVTVPAGTAPGLYYVIALADGDGAVLETQEGNNANWASVSVGPDLVIAGLTAPGSVRAGGSLALTDTTTNQGGDLAAASTTRFHLSVNAWLDASDTLLASRAVDPLPAGGTSTASTSVAIPPGTIPGFYYVLAQADGDHAVPETQEANNTRYVYVRVDP